MFKTLKMVAIALAASFVMTGTARAITTVSAGGSYDITSDNLFVGTVSTMGGPGVYSVNFTAPTAPLPGNAQASVTARILGTFTGLTMSWVDAATNTVLNSAALVSGVTRLNTTFLSTGAPGQNLVFSWANSSGTTNGGAISFDFDVAAVPLPAGGLLLLTALGGLALTRRRKAA